MESGVSLIFIFVVVAVVLVAAILKRYRRCPSDKILVVYGSTGKGSAKCVHGGGVFVWPIIQDYAYLSLTPISIEANLTNALSRQNIRVDVPCRFTVGISTEADSMNSAAERLLGLSANDIQDMARDILFGQLRLVIASMSIEELNQDRDVFQENIKKNVEIELKKIGLKLINVNITDIKDESGYIEALGKEAAAKAINDARVKVAEKENDAKAKVAEQEMTGESGKARFEMETRKAVAAANAEAIKGENNAKVDIANSNADLREREAEAQRRATAAEKIAAAKALEESYTAEQKAELARAEREQATQKANVIVAQEIEKQRMIVAAEAEAERKRVNAKGEADSVAFRAKGDADAVAIKAKGEADAIKTKAEGEGIAAATRARGEAEAIYAKMEAEAKGLYEVLTKQASGYDKMIQAAGGDATKAYTLLLLEKLPELVRTQVDAIKGISIDKVTVWDNGGANGKGGSTANFLSSLYKSIPPLQDLFEQAGMQLPEYLGKEKTEPAAPAVAEAEPAAKPAAEAPKKKA
ncbi:MAG: flotillin family protein [Bacteroidales bacterium]|nr:flotillin family protein [Bacteroidales bacterium]